MSARILIVDDTPLNVKLLAAKLKRDYYIISTAENGQEALEKVATEKPDLILLDIMMPEMDGFETCRRLKENPATAHIPVVIITALSDVEDRVRGLAAGADDFLGKPINDIALMARIRSLLRIKVLMDEWRLREATAQQMSPTAIATPDMIEVKNANILVIDGKDDTTATIKDALASISACITHVADIEAAESVLTERTYDLIFADLDVHSETGLQICSRLRTTQATRQTPILLMADASDIERVAKGLDLGANDYLIRPFDTQELFARSRTQLRHKRNYDRLRSGLEHSLMLALIDPLTGCFNRRYLEAHLPRFLQHAREIKKPLSVQMIDIDHFKKVNDRYGHNAGDTVLRTIAQRILNSIRPSDLCVRMGGEEFAIVMPETQFPHAITIAERMRHNVADTSIPLAGYAEELKVTVSIGVTETQPGSSESGEDIFQRADEALYRAKKEGRNRVVSASPDRPLKT